MTRKYNFTGETKINRDGVTLNRIVACQDIPRHDVKAGDLGGWIQYEMNLAHDGNAWVGGEAMVFGSLTQIFGDALVTGNAVVGVNCKISGNALVSDEAVIRKTKLTGTKIIIGGSATLSDVTIEGAGITLTEHAHLENVEFTPESRNIAVTGYAVVKHDWKPMWIEGHTIAIMGNAKILDVDSISGNVIVLNGDCILRDGVTLIGKDISITDACALEGRIIVNDRVHLKECVSLYHDEDEPVVLDGIELHGDMHKEVLELQAVNKR